MELYDEDKGKQDAVERGYSDPSSYVYTYGKKTSNLPLHKKETKANPLLDSIVSNANSNSSSPFIEKVNDLSYWSSKFHNIQEKETLLVHESSSLNEATVKSNVQLLMELSAHASDFETTAMTYAKIIISGIHS